MLFLIVCLKAIENTTEENTDKLDLNDDNINKSNNFYYLNEI